ncbi:MarR family winged helix-turn-helix transcriptional regulator [Acidocella sp.]|uniref:MarR family winged helix-turn-helix transcriptional regulator n=1 Tax=Acidocella sp. TaxID=50710 RepID=UPI0026129970|nr:MarR family winged helix-turn-helix transcriptional regulator [Acidocella sp.]
MPQAPAPEGLALNSFLPYRLTILADQVSRTAAQIYADRFDLTRPEWRIIASLSELGPVSATEICAHSAQDKMTVSRAVASLETRLLVHRHDDPHDRRNKILDLTPAGRALYGKIVPLILAREAYLLESFSPEERATLNRLLEALLLRARGLEQRG